MPGLRVGRRQEVALDSDGLFPGLGEALLLGSKLLSEL